MVIGTDGHEWTVEAEVGEGEYQGMLVVTRWMERPDGWEVMAIALMEPKRLVGMLDRLELGESVAGKVGVPNILRRAMC